MRPYFLFTLLLLLLFSCQEKQAVKEAYVFNEKEERVKILQMHNDQRKYHFEKDSVAFANQLSDNFISVNNGLITQPKKSETISRYHTYFSGVEFIKWDDVSDPIIRFSEDGKLAYTIVDKIVRTSYQNEAGESEEGETHFAWTAIYRKYGDEWKIDCVTSSSKPHTAEEVIN